VIPTRIGPGNCHVDEVGPVQLFDPPEAGGHLGISRSALMIAPHDANSLGGLRDSATASESLAALP
jgi:hypothetical protein